MVYSQKVSGPAANKRMALAVIQAAPFASAADGQFLPGMLGFRVLQSTQILLSALDSYALSHPTIRVSDKRFSLWLVS